MEISHTCLKSRTSLSMSGLDLRPLSGDTAEEPCRYKRNNERKKKLEQDRSAVSSLNPILHCQFMFCSFVYFIYNTELNLHTSLQEDQWPAGCCFPSGSPHAPDASLAGEKNWKTKDETFTKLQTLNSILYSCGGTGWVSWISSYRSNSQWRQH